MTAIDEIKANLDIVDIVSETVELRKTGKNYTGFCPFHSNSRTPAFVVFPDSGTWRCFGECNDGGDLFSFVMKKEGWDFPETLRNLAERAGVQLRAPTHQEEEEAEENEHLRTLLEEAVTYFRHQLYNTPPGKVAYEYLREKRQLTDETIEAFGLGYAPGSWDALSTYFKQKGHSEADMIQAGLVSERDSGGVYDRFRNRVMIPIRDARGRMAGFGARILDPTDVPKFLNSPQTSIFDKSALLYGLDRARKSIRTEDQVVIVEGYLDVIAPHQYGYANVVSPMGTALTEQQLRTLKRYTRKIVLAMDADAAGDKAAMRGLEIARQTMDREGEYVFDARGLLKHEARLQADIRVCTLPEGKDPDDIIHESREAWEELINNARPIVEHVMHVLARDEDINDPKTKEEIARQVLPLINDVPNAIERETYRQSLARLLRVDERALMLTPSYPQTSSRSSRRQQYARGTRQSEVQATPVIQKGDNREAHVIGILLRKPDLLYQIDRRLRQDGLKHLHPKDFNKTEYQMIFSLIQDSLKQHEQEPLEYVLNHLQVDIHPLADTVLEFTSKIDILDKEVFNDIMRSILTIRQRNLHQNNDEMRFLLEGIGFSDSLSTDYQQTVYNNTIILQRIDVALKRFTSRLFT